MKKILLSVLALALLCSCGTQQLSLREALSTWHSESAPSDTPAAGASVILRLTHSSREDSLADRAADTFGERLEQLSGGQLQVEVYADDTLGKLTTADSFGNGRIDMRLGITGAPYTNIVMWLPLLAGATLEDVQSRFVPGSTLYEMVRENAESQNVKILSVLPMQYRLVASTLPVESAADLSALKMRTFGEQTSNTLLWSLLCAETVPVEISQVPLSLQLGTVDACDNTLTNLCEYQIDAQITDITETSLVLYFDSLYIDLSSYQGLSAEQQEWIASATEYTETKMQQEIGEYTQNLRSELTEKGIHFHTLSAEDEAGLRSTVWQPIYDFYCSEYGSDVIDSFIAAVQEPAE